MDNCGICGGDNSSCGSDVHFVPAYLAHSSNPYLPMNISITSAQLAGANLETGDEIGIFDGSVCVGFGVVDGTIAAPGNMLPIVVSSKDGSIPGYLKGNTISYRFWD